MGLFHQKPKHPLAGLEPYDVRRGTQVALVNVEPSFVEHVRENGVKKPRIGMEAPIAIIASGDRILAYSDDQLIGEMDPDMASLYIDEMRALSQRGMFGRTVVYIKPEGFKSAHALALNWGVRAVDGGII